MESSRRIRITFRVPENAPIAMETPPVSPSIIAPTIMEDPPLDKLSITSTDNTARAVETPEGSLPATSSAFKVVKAGLKFSAEIETADSRRTLSEVLEKTEKLAEQLKSKGENYWTTDHMLELQECFSNWQNKRLRQYMMLEQEVPDAIHHEDSQHEPGPAYVHWRRQMGHPLTSSYF